MDYINSIYASGLKLRAKAVYMYLKSRSDKDGKCFPSIKTIAKDLDISQSTVKRALRELESNGYIKKVARYRENKGNTSNMYFLR
ncbi:helix-turn-helix domain-containing protein [Erysipelotrichaceae bacterium HCN-30851]